MICEKIKSGNTCLGIELGSTRIKACLIDESFSPVASGSFEWENKFENGYWTYSLDDIHKGVKGCYEALKADVRQKYNVTLKKIGAIGISGMMHGYLAFDAKGDLLVPFRTWRNTTTEEASEKLTELFSFNIPQRWSIAHLYQAILNGEAHVPHIAHITTLAGYIHYLLTGRYELGIGEASGMFPIDGADYDSGMIEKFSELISDKNYSWNIYDILPAVKKCGTVGAFLTVSGAAFLDDSGDLESGIPVCLPEGDAGTGMVATNSVKPKTGNVSAGTSVFSMLVLETALKGVYPEIDVVTTPDGSPVAMVHCNNGCSELDNWVRIFDEFTKVLGIKMSRSELYEILYKNALTGDADCGNIAAYNFIAGEPVAGIKSGTPMYFGSARSKMTLANFFRAQLYATLSVLKIGMEILTEKEGVTADNFNAHGGLFKVEGVAQQFLADALKTPVSVSETAGEGGAWGMALLAAFMMSDTKISLGDWLENKVFVNMKTDTLAPKKEGSDGFSKYFELYKKGLSAQKSLGEV